MYNIYIQRIYRTHTGCRTRLSVPAQCGLLVRCSTYWVTVRRMYTVYKRVCWWHPSGPFRYIPGATDSHPLVFTPHSEYSIFKLGVVIDTDDSNCLCSWTQDDSLTFEVITQKVVSGELFPSYLYFPLRIFPTR